MNNNFKFQIEEKLEGARLDVVLSLSLEEISRSQIQKLIENGQVKLNGEICKIKKVQVKEKDEIEMNIPAPEKLNIVGENIPLDIVFEDSHILIINKPKGMVVHPAPGNQTGTLVNAIMYHCGDRLSSINGIVRPGIVHRIDKNTSGLLMIAKTDMAHFSLAKQLADHSVNREYRAIVWNNFLQDEGQVNLPIGRDPKNRLKQAVTDIHSKEAVTHYKVIERFGDFTYLELKLETGRTHQIRVHMAHIKHPLLGDQVYGPQKKIFGVDTQMLHAKKIGFVHPETGLYMEFDSELPNEFKEVILKLKERK